MPKGLLGRQSVAEEFVLNHPVAGAICIWIVVGTLWGLLMTALNTLVFREPVGTVAPIMLAGGLLVVGPFEVVAMRRRRNRLGGDRQPPGSVL